MFSTPSALVLLPMALVVCSRKSHQFFFSYFAEISTNLFKTSRYASADTGARFNLDNSICTLISDMVAILACDAEKCPMGRGEENIILLIW